MERISPWGCGGLTLLRPTQLASRFRMLRAGRGVSRPATVLEFPGGASGLGSSVVPAVAWASSVAPVQSLASELPHATGTATPPKKSPNKQKPVKHLEAGGRRGGRGLEATSSESSWAAGAFRTERDTWSRPSALQGHLGSQRPEKPALRGSGGHSRAQWVEGPRGGFEPRVIRKNFLRAGPLLCPRPGDRAAASGDGMRALPLPLFPARPPWPSRPRPPVGRSAARLKWEMV